MRTASGCAPRDGKGTDGIFILRSPSASGSTSHPTLRRGRTWTLEPRSLPVTRIARGADLKAVRSAPKVTPDDRLADAGLPESLLRRVGRSALATAPVQ